MGLIPASPSVRSTDAQLVLIPGKSDLAGQGGMFLGVKDDGTGYELRAGGGGGGGGGGAVTYPTRVDCYDFAHEADGLGGTNLWPTPPAGDPNVYVDKLGPDAPTFLVDSIRGFNPATPGRFLVRVSVEVRWASGAADPTFMFTNANVNTGGAQGFNHSAAVWPAHSRLPNNITSWAVADFTWQPIRIAPASVAPGDFDVALNWDGTAIPDRVDLRMHFTKVGD